MSDGQTIILYGPTAVLKAQQLLARAPKDAVVNISAPKRTLDQNAKLWAMLSDVSRAKPEDRSLTPKVWKQLFMHSLDHEVRFEMALDGKGMVPIDYSTSRLTKAQMADLITTIAEYGDRHGVAWTDPEARKAA
jgi:hypothetical protein